MARRNAGQRAAGPDASIESLMDSQSRCVLVTGFGPFRQHLVNSSWEAVKELSKLGLGMDMDLELRTQQLPVDYREVKRRLTRIWEDFQPQCGKNRGYRDTDIRGFRPEDGACLPGGPEVMRSVVSMKKVCRHIAVEDVDVAFSGDAGRYICDYTYYLSLYLGNGRAALIHIPPLSRWFPASLLGKALQVIIQKILEDSEVLAPSMETPYEGKEGVASLEEIKCFNPEVESSSVL